MNIYKNAFIKSCFFVVILIVNNTPCINCKYGEIHTVVPGSKNKDSVLFREDTIYNVNFINQSSYLRPGFVGSPFLAAEDQLNIFILKSTNNSFMQVRIDETPEIFYSGDTHIPFIIKNKDTVYVRDQDENNNRKKYSLFSKNKERNSEINFFQVAINNKLPLLYWEKANQMNGLINVKSVTDNLSSLLGIFNKTEKFSEEYFKTNIVSNDFKTFIKSYIKFDHYVKIFLYIQKRNIVDSLINAGYFRFNVDTNNIYNHCNYAYHGALYQYLQFHLEKSKSKSDIHFVYSVINSIFDSYSISVIKYIYLKNNFNSMYLENKAQLVSLIKQIRNSRFEKVLLNKISFVDYSIQNKNNIINQKNTVFGLPDIIAGAKGKLIFIDFWASWCAPCRSEFSNYPDLIKKIDTNKVQLVFISIDASKETWLKASGEEKLNPANNYLLINPSGDVLKRMNLNTIPRYYLYDKHGKLISNDAPKPSDPELKDLIDRNL